MDTCTSKIKRCVTLNLSSINVELINSLKKNTINGLTCLARKLKRFRKKYIYKKKSPNTHLFAQSSPITIHPAAPHPFKHEHRPPPQLLHGMTSCFRLFLRRRHRSLRQSCPQYSLVFFLVLIFPAVGVVWCLIFFLFGRNIPLIIIIFSFGTFMAFF